MPNNSGSPVMLVVVILVCALVLTGMNMWSEPIVEERELEEHLEALEGFFAGAADYEEVEIDGITFEEVYDEDGEFLGAVASYSVEGYSDYIYYRLAISGEGEIRGIEIDDHDETPDIGGVIEEPEFQEQFEGMPCKEPEDVRDLDVVTGATKSTEPIIKSAGDVVEAFCNEYMD